MASCTGVCGSEQFKSMPDSGFGVRSYLHYFYEECTASVWDQQDVQNQRSSQWWGSGLCKIFLALGALALVTGIVALAVGCSVPSRIEAFGEGELLFVDRQAVQYNRMMNVCLQVGTGMISLGGLLMAAGVLLSAFCKPAPRPQPGGREKKVIMGGGGGGDGKSQSKVVTGAPSPASGVRGVPVTFSEVENVQP